MCFFLGYRGRGISCRACRASHLELEPPAQRAAQLPRQGDVGAHSSPAGFQCGPRARKPRAPARIGDQRSPKKSFPCRFGVRDCDRSTVEVSGRPTCRNGLVLKVTIRTLRGSLSKSTKHNDFSQCRFGKIQSHCLRNVKKYPVLRRSSVCGRPQVELQ